MKRKGQAAGKAGGRSKFVMAALLAGSAALGGSGLALANVATPRASQDGIVGAWVGQAAQPDQDPFDVRLTFVSSRGGVSRYPSDPTCGGLLVGDRDGDHYEYDETITYGSSEDVDQGCLNGKLKLSVAGDTMKLDWTSTNAEGDQLTASGELHRVGNARKR